MVPNQRAFLNVIAACEGTAHPDGYRALFGWRPGNDSLLFTSFADHPRIRTYEKDDEFIRNGVKDYTTAAGKWQITETTWNWFVRSVGPRDFSPASQDECALWLIDKAGATKDVLAGDLETALSKCSGTWASLPGSPYGQPTRSLQYCQAVFARSVEEELTQPAAPIEDRSTPARPQDIPAEQKKEQPMGFLASLLLSLAPAFAPVLQQQMTRALGAKNEKTASDVTAQLMGIVQSVAAASLPPQVTPESPTPVPVDPARIDPVVAIATIKSNPKLMSQVEAQFSDRMAFVMPVVDRIHELQKEEWAASDASQAAAFERNRLDPSQNIQRPMLNFTMAVVAGCTAFTGGLLAWQMFLKDGEEPNGQLIILFVMLVTTFVNMLRTQNDWGFGSSRQSSAKDATINELAKR
jgi:muramidase (phage lysozyme)